jgi:hypothetical protein
MIIWIFDAVVFKPLRCRAIFIGRWYSNCSTSILLRARIKRNGLHLSLFVIIVIMKLRKVIQFTFMPRVEEFFILEIHAFESLWNTHALRGLSLMITHSTSTLRLLWRILGLKNFCHLRHIFRTIRIKLTRSVYDLVLNRRWVYIGIHFI